MPSYTLKIKPAFRNANRPHTPEELAELESHILRTGEILDPILIWKNFIIDGHGRYEIAQKHGLDYQVRVMSFPSEKHAEMWIRAHQNTRRNNSQDQVLYNMGLVHAFYSDQAAEQNQKPQEAQVTKQVADLFGASKSMVRHAAKHKKHVDELEPATKRAYEQGKLKGAGMGSIEKLAKLPVKWQRKARRLIERGESKTLDAALRVVTRERRALEQTEQEKPKVTSTSSKPPKRPSDTDLERAFDGYKRMVRYMPKKMYNRVRDACDQIDAEFQSFLGE